MGTFLKIKPARLYDYNNAEYLNFLRRLRALLPLENADDRPGELSLLNDEPSGAPALGISAELVAGLDGYIAQLTELNNQSRISQETASLTQIDKERDNVAIYITNRIARASALPLQAERDAGVFLANVVKPYIGLARLPYNQETEAVRGLLVDLRKTENASAVETLALAPYMTELERLNNHYEEVVEARSANRLANALDNSKKIRTQADDLYEDMADLAYAWSLAHPSDEAAAFIRNLNALIDEMQVAVHLRAKGDKKKDDKPAGDDRPGEL